MMEEKIAYGRAHGKIILMGEHAVVYGEPSIALPFPAVQMTAKVKRITGPLRVDCSFYHGIADEMPEVLESFKKTIDLALSTLQKPSENLAISIDSTIPAERGMGSSAAVAVAVIRALYQYFDKALSIDVLLHLVNEAEKVAHGNPSGLDAAMTSGDSPLYFQKGQAFVPIQLHMDAYLVVGDTGVTGQTKEAVQSIADQLATEKRQDVQQQIQQLGFLAEEVKRFLQENIPASLGRAMDHAHILLTELGVSNEDLDRLVLAAKKAGALGAKLTGGGRGGCMIALAETLEQAKEIQQGLTDAGAVQTWIASLKQEEQK